MSIYNRYCFLKKAYPGYVIFIVRKGKLITFKRDLKIVNYKGLDDFFNSGINYIILDGLEPKVFNGTENHYFYYFKVTLLEDIIDYIKYR